MPTIAPTTVGFSSYTVSSSANGWFYLDLDLEFGQQADLELRCPTAAVVRLTETGPAGTVPLSTTGVTPTVTTAALTLDSSATAAGGGSTLTITIVALTPFHTAWLLRVGGIPAGMDAAFQVNAGDALITRVLADPVVSAPAPAAAFEKAPISLPGTANYTTVPPGPSPAGTPSPPTLRARWSQTGPATISAPPPNQLFSATVGSVLPLNATIAASPAFTAPGVYAAQQLGYRLTAFYDDVSNQVLDPGEPVATADVTLQVKPRTQHMLLVVDRSGSMLAPMPGTALSRWEFARRAAHVWVDLWSALRGSISAKDRAGVMIFEASPCGWNGVPAKPIEILLPPTGKPGSVDALDVAALDIGEPGSCTPIGDALIGAIDAFVGLAGSTDDRYVILLLTDGFENSGAIVVEDDSPVPPGATATFDSRRAVGPRAAVSTLLSIYTLGLGPAGTVQDSVLQDLTDNPTTQRGLYRPIQADGLMGAFGEMLGHALEAENITPLDPNTAIPVSANEHRLAFALRLDGAGDRMKLFRTVSGGVEEQVAGPGSIATPGITERLRANHALVDVDLVAHFGATVPSSSWRVEYWVNGVTPQAIAPGGLLALIDLFVKADIRFDRVRYATGQRVQVTCQISAGGEPVTGARVEVELARPGEGLGTFLSRNGARYKPPSDPQGPDPLAPKAAMLQTLLKQQEREGLVVEHQQIIFLDQTNELWDDGLHRDGPADDGTYANTYAGLQHEGSYEWRFTITGTTPDGEPFLRVATRSFWVAVGVDPNATKVGVRLVDRPHVRRVAEITVLPADARGELLGPFRGSEVSITCNDGQFLPFSPVPPDGVVFPQPDKGELFSGYDGRYIRLLSYDPANPPQVQITIGGRRLPDLPLP